MITKNFTISRQVVIACCLVFSAAFTFYILKPKYQEWNLNQKKIESKKDEILTSERYFFNLRETAEKLKEYQNELSEVNAVVPGPIFAPAFYRFIIEITEQSGMGLEQMGQLSNSPSADFPSINESRITVSVSGSYVEFKNYLSLLARSEKMIEVENISFSAPGQAGSPFTVNLTLKAYSSN